MDADICREKLRLIMIGAHREHLWASRLRAELPTDCRVGFAPADADAHAAWQSDEVPDAAIIMPDHPRPLAVARALGAQDPLSHIVLVSDHAQRLRRHMSFGVSAGSLSVVEAGDPPQALAARIGALARQARRARTVRTALDQLNTRVPVEGGMRPARAISESYLASLLLHLPKAIVSTDLSTRIVSWNPAAETLFGRSARVSMGGCLEDLFVPEERERVAQLWRRAREGGAQLQQEVAITGVKDAVLANLVMAPIRHEGEVVGVIAILRDITEQKRAEEALHRREQEFKALAEHSPDAVMRFDRGARHVYLNPAAQRALGIPLQAVLGRTAGEAGLPPTYCDGVGGAIDRVLDSGREVSLELALETTGSARFLQLRLVPETNREGATETVLGVARDVTDSVRTQRARTASLERERRARRDLQLALRALARRETATRFLADASRELTASLDYETTLARVAQLAVPQFADWCAVDIADRDGRLTRVAVVHVDPEKAQLIRDLHRRFPPRAETACGPLHVLRSGEAELIAEVTPEMLADYAMNAEHLAVLRSLGLCSYMCLPLRARGQAHGAITLATAESGAHFDQEQFSMALGLAERAGLAVDNARLFQETQAEVEERKRAEQQLAYQRDLAEVTLHAIGDGVIRVSADGAVEYLNPVAEALTGWRDADARGRPAEEVFHVVDERTRLPQPSPILQCLREERTVLLAGHSLLLARDGREFGVEDSAAPIRDHSGRIIGVVLVFRDVSEPRNIAREMAYRAAHDPLTALVNRTEFERRLQDLLDGERRQRYHALLYIDLDQFKVVNDTCGHSAGDELLRQLSGVLMAEVRQSDTLARLGGDEFALLLVDCGLHEARRVADKLLDAVRGFRYKWKDKTFGVGASMGLVLVRPQHDTLAGVLSAADSACYMAKEQGRNRVQLYRSGDRDVARRHAEMSWVTRLPQAMEERRLLLYHQNIEAVHTAPERMRQRYEILLRMRDEKGSLLPPGAFIPAAERYNLMPELDRWVVREVFAGMRDSLDDKGDACGMCSINLSGVTLSDEHFAAFVRKLFQRYALPPELIGFEITETAAIGNLSKAVTFIDSMRALGCTISLDDFGSGLSSFAYLKNLHVDYLKIDGIFVKDMVEDAVDGAMVEAINRVGDVMGIRTVAEYVESPEILHALQDLGVDYAQGYAVHRPEPWRWAHD